MLFAVCCDRGAPGASTIARVLASARGLPAVVVGADPYGDDMARRLRPDGNLPLPERPTVLGIGAELGNNDNSDIIRALRQGATGTFNQVGQQAVGQGLSVAPTLTIRPGAPVRVMVTRDLILEPYRK